MTPGARVQAAIECLDAVLDGGAAERVLTGWARGARYAGSKDRAAVRDHVYDVLRRKRACEVAGTGQDGRALMIGLLCLAGAPPREMFNGIGHSPAVLTEDEGNYRFSPDLPPVFPPEVPEWLFPLFSQTYDDVDATLAPLTMRAEVFLRVNLRKATPADAMDALSQDGITAVPAPLAKGALRVVEGARRIRHSAAYENGLVELQDAASQAAVETLPVHDNMRVLDFCAGGGGKTLAMGNHAGASFFAHDANPGRMRDLPVRARRAGLEVALLDPGTAAQHGPFDLVLCDVPCSGSGTWRRDPDAKWRFAPEGLEALNRTQDAILDEAAPLVAQGGVLAYATCSLLSQENEARITAFVARTSGWDVTFSRQWTLEHGADGFFVAHLLRHSD